MPEKVIIIGGGLAGITAALAVSAGGGEALIMDKGSVGVGNNSTMANGYFTAPTESYPAQEYIKDTIDIGYGLNRRSWVAQVAQAAPRSLEFMEKQGLVMNQGFNNYIFPAKRPDHIRGFEMMTVLARLAKDNSGISRLPFCRVLDLLKQDGRVVGVRLVDRSGRIRTEYAGAVILAAGGAGAIWQRNDNMKSQLGQGYLLAARMGLALMDMEFVQFYPVVVAEPKLPLVMLYPPYPEGSRLLAADGRDLLAEYGLQDLNAAIQKMRDSLSALLYRETKNGPVHIDFREVQGEVWDRYPMAMLKHIKFDFHNKPVSITPGAHFIMGGVPADENCRSGLPGLLLCGEMLWGLHGANRRGGNALMECLASGFLAGRSALEDASQAGNMPPGAVEQTLDTAKPAQGAKELLQRLRQIAWDRAGVIREAAALDAGLSELAELEERVAGLPDDSLARLGAKQDLVAASLVLKCTLIASQARHESRGALIRDDFPQQDDTNWLVNSQLKLDPETGQLRLAHLAVEG